MHFFISCRTETRVRALKAEFLKGKGSPDLVSNAFNNLELPCINAQRIPNVNNKILILL